MRIFIIANLIGIFFFSANSFAAEYHFNNDNLIGIDTKADQKRETTKVVTYITPRDIYLAKVFLRKCLRLMSKDNPFYDEIKDNLEKLENFKITPNISEVIALKEGLGYFDELMSVCMGGK